MARPGEKQSQVVVYLGYGAHRRTWIAPRALLVDGYRRAQPLDIVDIRFLHPAQKLPGVGGQGLYITSLSLGVNGVECQ